jgi:hypothetical protein
MQLTVSRTPSFTLNTTSLLENPQVISSAFDIYIETDRSDCHIYASIPSGIATTSSTPMAPSNIILDFNNTDCPSAYIGSYTTADIPLSTSNTLLFYKLKHKGGVSHWYYDCKIPALGYSYRPGTYNYTIKFTMTQP